MSSKPCEDRLLLRPSLLDVSFDDFGEETGGRVSSRLQFRQLSQLGQKKGRRGVQAYGDSGKRSGDGTVGTLSGAQPTRSQLSNAVLSYL